MILVALSLALGCHGQGGSSTAVVPPIPGSETQPIATVAGQEISLDRFNLLYHARVAVISRHQGLSEAARRDLKLAIASELIDEQLIENTARRRGVTLDEQRLDTAVRAFAGTFPDADAYRGFEENYPDRAGGVRALMRFRLLRNELAGVVLAETISEQDARSLFDEQRAQYQSPSHLVAFDLVLKLPATASPDQVSARRAEAEKLAQMARDPAISFSALAQQNSEGPTAQIGGYLGEVTENSVEPAVWRALSTLKPGEVSDVLSAASSFHVVKLALREPKRNVSFETARPEIETALREARRLARIALLMQSLRVEARIDNQIARRFASSPTSPSVPPTIAKATAGFPGVLGRPAPTGPPGAAPGTAKEVE